MALCNDGEKDYLESPMMNDGTIEENFEKALAREVALAGKVESPETPAVTSQIFEGDIIMKTRVEYRYKMVISDVY